MIAFKQNLLFIDTETTGKPKKWNLPYSATDNWPSAVQLSWILFDKNGFEIKRENFYIDVEDLKISSRSQKIHGISREFLTQNGQTRRQVLKKLSEDIVEFNPLIVGHFTEFDIHTLSCDFYRSDLENPFTGSQFYCTMLKSKEFNSKPEVTYLRLPELYQFLFNENMTVFHNALYDVEATAKCFHKIFSEGKISEDDLKTVNEDIMHKLMFEQ